MQARIWRPIPFGLLLVLLSAGAFWPGLPGGFFLDDFHNIVNNPRVHAASLDGDSLMRAMKAYDVGGSHRALATVSFAANHAIGGLNPYGYKLVNIVLHTINAVLVFALVRLLLNTGAIVDDKGRDAVAGLAAMVWAVHPLQVSTVLYVVQRMEILAATFVLLGLLAYLHGRLRQIQGRRGTWWLLASVALAAAGLLAKESSLLFVPICLALELTLLRFNTGQGSASKRLIYFYTTLFLMGLVVFAFWLLPRFAPPESFDIRTFTQWERVLTQFRVLNLHLLQILVPAPDLMPVYYDNFPKSSGLLKPWTTLAGLLAILAALGLAWHLRQRAPLVSLGVFWYFAAHSLTSSPLNLELVFEHRNYLPLLGIILAATGLLIAIPTRDGPGIKWAGAVLVATLFFALTLVRSATWGNPLLLAADLAARAPGSQRASNDLAVTYVNHSDGNPDSPFIDFAIAEFTRGMTLGGPSPFPEQGLILIASMRGVPAKEEWWESLISKLRSQPIGPESVLTVVGMLNQHNKGFKVDNARLAEAYEALIDRRKAWPGHVLANFADFLYDDLGDPERATRYYVRAVTDNPGDQEFARHLLATLIMEGRARPANAVADAMSNANLLPAGPANRNDDSPKM